MIDLERLVIKPGDSVKRIGIGYQSFTVKETKIINLVQMVYPEVGPPIPADELEVVSKYDATTPTERNKLALEEILESLYGDNWSIQDNMIIIHYPLVEINNSRGESHTIRDLYVSLNISSDFTIHDRVVRGMRTTATQDEIDSSYSHSHLSQRPFSDWSTFCTGSGIIDEVLIQSREINPSENRFHYEMLFETLDAFVAWESLEGGPYRRMNNIGIRSGSYYPNVYYNGDAKEYFGLIKYLDIEIPFEIRNINKAGDISKILSIDKKKLGEVILDKLLTKINDLPSKYKELLETLIAVEIGGTQRTLNRRRGESVYTTVINILNTKEVEEESSNELRVVSTRASQFKFRGETLIYKTLSYKNYNSEIDFKKKDLQINKRVLSSLQSTFLKSFYGKLFETSADEFVSFISKSANNQA